MMQRAGSLDWKDRDDGSSWATCEVNGQSAVVVVVDTDGRKSITLIVEVSTTDSTSSDDAKRETERWLKGL